MKRKEPKLKIKKKIQLPGHDQTWGIEQERRRRIFRKIGAQAFHPI